MLESKFQDLLAGIYSTFGREKYPLPGSLVYASLWKRVGEIPDSACAGILKFFEREFDNLPTNLGKAIWNAYYSLENDKHENKEPGCEQCDAGYVFFVDEDHPRGFCAKCPQCNKGDPVEIENLSMQYVRVPAHTSPMLEWSKHFDPKFDYKEFVKRRDEFKERLFANKQPAQRNNGVKSAGEVLAGIRTGGFDKWEVADPEHPRQDRQIEDVDLPF